MFRVRRYSLVILTYKKPPCRTPLGHKLEIDQQIEILWSATYNQTMDYRERITIEPGKRGGKPCIRGLRITVYDVLEYLASGMSEEEIVSDFPDLSKEDIRACLAFAADRERKMVSVPPVV